MDKLSTVFVSSLETTLFQFRARLFFFSKKRSSLLYVTNIFGIVAQCKDDTYESNGRVVLV